MDNTVISIISMTISLIALCVALLRNRWMSKQMKLSSAIAIIGWLEEIRPLRQILYKTREEKKPFSKWNKDELEAANKVTRKLDILGMLENLDYLDHRLVDRFYAIPTNEIWSICKEWIIDERSRRGPQHLWEFEKLAGRLSHVKSNHPALTKKENWPRKPRENCSA